MKRTQKICVTAFVSDKNKVLVLKRSGKENFLPGYWEMPGGKIEFGESPEDAVGREIKEETNLKVKAIKPYSLFSYFSENKKRHTIDIQFIAKILGNSKKIRVNKSHSDFKWLSAKELNRYKFSNLMKNSIKRGFHALKS